MGMTHHHISCHVAKLCFSCVHRRVVEGSGVGSAWCVVHVDVHGILWVAAMYIVAWQIWSA